MGVAAPPKQSGGGLTSLLAGILALVTAGLAIGGSFAPITTFHDSFADGDFSGTEVNSDLSWWGVNGVARVAPFDEGGKLFGLSLVLVATLLVLGAAFAFVASRTRAPGPTTGGRSLITAGVGVLAGVVVLQSLLVLEEASAYNDRELEPGESLKFTPGLGLVLPLCALVLGVVAVVLAHVGQRPREQRLEPSTPRMGFPAPYGYRQAPGVQAAPAMPGVPVTTPATGASAAVDPGAQGTADEWADAADDSSETTQRVSNATATGVEPAAVEEAAVATPPDAPTPAVPATPASAATAEAAPAEASEQPGAPTTAPASPEPARTNTLDQDAASAAPAEATPAHTPEQTVAPAPPESTPANAPGQPAAPATRAPESATAESAAAPAAEPATQEDPAASPATDPDHAEKPVKLGDLPAAPPPPETKQD